MKGGAGKRDDGQGDPTGRGGIPLPEGQPAGTATWGARSASCPAAKPDALTPDVLRRIEGFGEMRIKKYGERLLVDVI